MVMVVRIPMYIVSDLTIGFVPFGTTAVNNDVSLNFVNEVPTCTDQCYYYAQALAQPSNTWKGFTSTNGMLYGSILPRFAYGNDGTGGPQFFTMTAYLGYKYDPSYSMDPFQFGVNVTNTANVPTINVLSPAGISVSVLTPDETQLFPIIDFTDAFHKGWLPYMQCTFASTWNTTVLPPWPMLIIQNNAVGEDTSQHNLVIVHGMSITNTAQLVIPFTLPTFSVELFTPYGTAMDVGGDFIIVNGDAVETSGGTFQTDVSLLARPYSAGFDLSYSGGSATYKTSSTCIASCTLPETMTASTITILCGITGMMAGAQTFLFQLFPMPEWISFSAPSPIPDGVTWTVSGNGTVTVTVATPYLLGLSMTSPDPVVGTYVGAVEGGSFAMQGIVQTWHSPSLGSTRVRGPRGGTLVSVDVSLTLAIQNSSPRTPSYLKSLRNTQTVIFERGVGTAPTLSLVFPITTVLQIPRGTYIMTVVAQAPSWARANVESGEEIVAYAVPISAVYLPPLHGRGCALKPPVPLPVVAKMNSNTSAATLRLGGSSPQWLVTVCWTGHVGLTDSV
jgi:hypothetical protein